MAVTSDGTTFLECGTSGLPNPGTASTLMTWFKVSANDGNTHGFVNLMNTLGSLKSAQIGYRSTTLRMWIWGGTDICDSGMTPTVGQWYHLAYTYDGVNSNKLYVDAVLKSSVTNALSSDSVDRLKILGDQFAENLIGTQEDARVYDRALSLAEIETIFACRGHDDIVRGLRARFPLNELSPGTSLSNQNLARDISIEQNTPASGAKTGFTYADGRLSMRKRR